MDFTTLLAIPNTTPVDFFDCKLLNIYDRKTGKGEHGDWSFQNLTVEMGVGNTIKVLLKNCPPFEFYSVGSQLRFTAYDKGNNKGLSGVYADDETYQGKVTRQIKITKTATLDLLDGNGAAAPFQTLPTNQPPVNQQQPQSAPVQHQETAINQQAQAAAPVQQNTEQTAVLNAAKHEIVKIMNLHLLCACAVELSEAPAFEKKTGKPMSEPQKQAATASIYIKAERSGLVDRMPKTIISE